MNISKLFPLLIVVALVNAPNAQKIGTAKTGDKMKQVAFLPLMFHEMDGGHDGTSTNETAIGTYAKNLYGVFERLGIERFEQAAVNARWRTLNGTMFAAEAFQTPPATALVELGKSLGVDYVVVSRLAWKIRSPWVGLGPKTKAHATLDLWVVDVNKSEFALKADEVKADSTEKAPDWKWAVDLLVAPVSMFSGGPKTPHMQRSATIVLGRAINPWVTKQVTASNKIGG